MEIIFFPIRLHNPHDELGVYEFLGVAICVISGVGKPQPRGNLWPWGTPIQIWN